MPRGHRIVAWFLGSIGVVGITGLLGLAIAALRPRAISHCAGAAHVPSAQRDATTALRINALGTHYLIDAVRRARLETRVVVIGSALVYRTCSEALTEAHPLGPSDPYGLSKLAQEVIAIESAREGLDVVLVRPFNHIGPRQQPSFATSSFARQIALAEAGLPLMLPASRGSEIMCSVLGPSLVTK